MKLCKDCKFYKRDLMTWYTGRFSKCSRKNVIKPNLVTGRGESDENEVGNYCSIEREFENLCGPSAVYFEKR